MASLTYPNTGDLKHTTKEAVASAILHQTYDRLRGAGPTGRIIYREKPAKVLHTQQLLPRRQPSQTATSYLEKEDVTSPAHIATVGLTFQIANRRDKSISVSIRACIYLRILPTANDLAVEPVKFRLSQDARRVILRYRREALRRAEDQNRALLGPEGRRNAAWPDIKKRASDEADNAALLELGISPASLEGTERRETFVSILHEEDEGMSSDDPSVDDTALASSPSESWRNRGDP